ncbi:MAG: tRNA epoxyqueuosine(34) reductase QueG, partial [Rhizobiaceae bacterium]
MNQADSLISALKSASKDLGFEAFGISQPQLKPDTARDLRRFVAKGHHGSMAWMKETLERRSNPITLWPEVKSIIVVAMNYGPETDPLLQLENKEQGAISVYARHRDYHDVIKGRLKTLAAQLCAQASRRNLQCDVKVFVDTAPVMEKPLAQEAGLGWQGKHTNLVSRNFGSWLFLGSIFTTLELPAGEQEIDHCGSCSNCLDICPTNAFPAPYQIDAR